MEKQKACTDCGEMFNPDMEGVVGESAAYCSGCCEDDSLYVDTLEDDGDALASAGMGTDEDYGTFTVDDGDWAYEGDCEPYSGD